VQARCIRNGVHAEPLLGQIALQQVAQAQIVVDHQNSCLGLAHRRIVTRWAERLQRERNRALLGAARKQLVTNAGPGVANHLQTRSNLRTRPRMMCSMAAIALPTSAVVALPPMSRVRGPSASTRSIARMIASPASLRPRCSSIIAPDQICPIGFAMFLPAMSGAEPCTGSNTEGNLRSGLMLPEGAMPMVPV